MSNYKSVRLTHGGGIRAEDATKESQYPRYAPRRRKRRRMIRALTLGIAAVADWNPMRPSGTGDESIVLVSEREYEDLDGARAESPVPKRVALIQRIGLGRCGWFCLFSTQDLAEVDDFTREFRAASEVPLIEAGHAIPETGRVMGIAETAYKNVKRSRGAAGFNPEFIVAGFDEADRPALFQLGESGRAELRAVPGYATTGSGAAHAGPQLYWHNLQPNDPLHEAIYKCWSAKLHSEKIVGPTTDVAVMIPDHEQPIEVGAAVRLTVESALAALEAPVFAPRRPREPQRWREDLEQRVEDMLQETRAADEERWKNLR